MDYKVLLPTSGTGSRLGEITKTVNKSMVPLAGRPAIDYILDSYPKETPFVITLGYLGQDVKNYLEEKHKDRIFEFVWVDKYEGFGSSLGYSMLQAKNNLQCPFVFHACDGIFVEKIPEPDHNWIGSFVNDWKKSELPLEQYRTHTIKKGKVFRFNDRGVSGSNSIHIGLDGIKDYEIWWQALEEIYNQNPADPQISDVPVLERMMEKGTEFSLTPFSTWLDIGNVTTLKRAENYLRTVHKVL